MNYLLQNAVLAGTEVRENNMETQFKKNDKVVFQFNDDGVLRTAVGNFQRVTSGNLYECNFKDSSCSVECVPSAVRPYYFSYFSLVRRVNKLIESQTHLAFAGSYPVEIAREVRREHNKLTKEFSKFISFLK